MNKKNNLIEKYLNEFPNLPIMTLAKKIYNENKLKFKSLENVRSKIRYLKGNNGKLSLKKLKQDKYLNKEKLIEKYNLPKSIEIEYKPYQIINGNMGLIFSDLHIPFHSKDAIEAMFDYTINKNIDFIILNGDIMDCFELSVFCKEPDLVTIKEERDLTKQFLMELKRIYPKAKIYFKFGNHEKRFEDYIKIKAPEIWDFTEFRLNILLDLFNLKIEYIEEFSFITMGYLSVIHGHEYKKAITSPANPARTLFLRTKSCTIGGHYHQTSEHTEPKINGDMITCWSLGCLCELHPKYMPLNKWNHGFALYEKEDNFWHIENKRIIQGKVV